MQTSFLDTVRSNVDRMNTIVSDLNDLTKIQVGNLRLEYQTLHIRETLDEVIRSLNRQIEEKEAAALRAQANEFVYHIFKTAVNQLSVVNRHAGFSAQGRA